MNTEHLLEAIKETARQYEGSRETQLIVEILRGIVARAQRYEAQEVEQTNPWRMPENPQCDFCGAPATLNQIASHKLLLRCRACVSPLMLDEWEPMIKVE